MCPRVLFCTTGNASKGTKVQKFAKEAIQICGCFVRNVNLGMFCTEREFEEGRLRAKEKEGRKRGSSACYSSSKRKQRPATLEASPV